MQFRLSEALIVLCWFEPVLAVGVTLGCFLANIFSTVTALDIVIGTLATPPLPVSSPSALRIPAWLPLPNILANAILVGGMLAWVIFPNNLATGFAIAFAQWALASWSSCTPWACPCSLRSARPVFPIFSENLPAISLIQQIPGGFQVNFVYNCGLSAAAFSVY